MKSLLSILSVISLSATNLLADDSKPTDGFVDKLTSGTNITINTTANLTENFASQGMTLTVSGGIGSEWYWSNGAGYSYDNANGLAFPLDPANKQDKLVIVVKSITPGATLKVGAFFFNGGALIDGKNQILGAEDGGINITTAGAYEFDVSKVAKVMSMAGATNWKADFWFSSQATVGQAVTISSIAASPGSSTSSSSSH